ncbi:MAG: hypothetical protein NT049_15965, partial [Planctomycetota bacterium]|nr:hypothetical protein [Planctomycetota bacterium]
MKPLLILLVCAAMPLACAAERTSPVPQVAPVPQTQAKPVAPAAPAPQAQTKPAAPAAGPKATVWMGPPAAENGKS